MYFKYGQQQLLVHILNIMFIHFWLKFHIR